MFHSLTDQKTGNWKTFWQITEVHHECWHMQLTANSHLFGNAIVLTPSTVPQRFVKARLIPHWSEIEEHCFSSVEWIERNRLHCANRFHSDSGTEFLALAKRSLWKEIDFSTASAYTPQPNGVAERIKRTLIRKKESMLHSAGMHTQFCVETVMDTAHLYNHTATSTIDMKTLHK